MTRTVYRCSGNHSQTRSTERWLNGIFTMYRDICQWKYEKNYSQKLLGYFSNIGEIFSYCPYCPNSPKLKIYFDIWPFNHLSIYLTISGALQLVALRVITFGSPHLSAWNEFPSSNKKRKAKPFRDLKLRSYCLLQKNVLAWLIINYLRLAQKFQVRAKAELSTYYT